MLEALYEGGRFNLRTHLSLNDSVKEEIGRLKKAADKGAFSCPYCGGILKLRAGNVNEKHFYHPRNSCAISEASETYQKQTKRESKSHSVMKEIIYDELKTQEKINDNLQIEYGYVKKAEEKWRYYPDIIVDNKKSEIAISILTDVTATKDASLVRQIKKRNDYFKEKNLKPVWFVEKTEQSIDMDYRVIHLWEAELDIAIKMEEDYKWEEAVSSLEIKNDLFDLFKYHYRSIPSNYDVRGLYYVKSTATNIIFTVQRFIAEEFNHPYRAFALNDAYEIKMSTALLMDDVLQLSDPLIEEKQRNKFIKDAYLRDKEYVSPKEEGISINPVVKTTMNFTKNYAQHGISEILDEYIKEVNVVSAEEFSKFLVLECGAPAATYATGRYQLYREVCMSLKSFESSGKIKLKIKDYVNDLIYEVIESN